MPNASPQPNVYVAEERAGELTALRWEDVNLADGVIHVRRGWDAKEGEISPQSKQGRRRVPIPAALRDHLLERKLATGGDGRVFGSLAQVRRAAERGAKAMVKAGIEPWRSTMPATPMPR
jgi:integrase